MVTVGLIGLDVGVTTGMASGLFNPALRDRAGLWRALARGRKVKAEQIGGPEYDIRDCGKMVAAKVLDLIADWNIAGLGTDSIYIIIEDFQVRKDLIGGSKKDKLAPVYIAGYVDGIVTGAGWGRNVYYILPSMTKNKANDARLKYWANMTKGRAGWIKGKPHTRDAFRLIATGLDKEVP